MKIYYTVIIALFFISLSKAHLGVYHKDPFEGLYHVLDVLFKIGPAEIPFEVDWVENGVKHFIQIGNYKTAYIALIVFIFIIFLIIFNIFLLYYFKLPKPLIFGANFVIVSFVIMFLEGIFYDEQQYKPSAVLVHAHSSIPLHYRNYPLFANFSEIKWTSKDILESRKDLIKELDDDNILTIKELKPEIIYENGEEIKVFRLNFQGIVKKISPGIYIEAFSFNGMVPGPIIRVKENDNVRIIVCNNHTGAHTVHWHGVHVYPYTMDGVQILTQKVIEPGECYTYEFKAKPGGVFWYHCHVEDVHHIDMGLQGPFIIEPRNKTLDNKTIEQIVILDDWSSGLMNHNLDMSEKGPLGAGWLRVDSSANPMPMHESDIWTVNGKAFPYTLLYPIIVENGTKLRLIIYNTGKDYFSWHIHGHTFKVVEQDGFPLEAPYYTDTILIAPAQRFTVEVELNNPGIWILHDHTPKSTFRNFDLGGASMLIVYKDYLNDENFKYIIDMLNYYIERAERYLDLGLFKPMIMKHEHGEEAHH